MKRIYNLIVAFLLFSTLFISCNKDDNPDPDPDNSNDITLDNPINKFVWNGMNSWYYWQTDVPNLADSKKTIQNDFYSFLNNYSSSENLFYDLCYMHTSNVSESSVVDRFSWFIDDYIEQEKAFQGITKSFGFRLQAVQINESGDIIFYVRFVSNASNSPALNANIKRGDIIYAIDGVSINESNYSTLVDNLSNDSVTLSFASENNGELTPIQDKTITAVEIEDNPIHLVKTFDDINGKKVGYLVYNGFRSSYNDELNDAFEILKSENIDELVLDLRLNGGGSVETTSFLASMIYSNATSADVLAHLRFNEKHVGENGSYNFENTLNVYNASGLKTGTEAINKIASLNKLYVLTSGSTASASEMIINGLRPYIDVIAVGSTTYGKNVGSITLYDSPGSDYTSQTSANSTHKNAMQPIVFRIFNKNGESDYIQGFQPNIEVKEWYFWNSILPFGDENEQVLKAALDHIRGISSRASKSVKFAEIKAESISKLENKFENEMYIENIFNK